MKLKSSFTAILFIGCGLLFATGCQQQKKGNTDKDVPQAVRQVILQKYPGATITDYDKDAAGAEVDIRDKGVKKEILLGVNNEWISTKQDIRAESVPVVVMDNLTNSAYHEYHIEEVSQVERTSGTYYVFELKQNNNEVKLTFNSDGQLIR